MSNTDSNTDKTLFDRLRNFIEKNHEDNLQQPTGWHDRLQNIYVSHHSIKEVNSGSLHQWQKYSNKK